MTREEAKKRLEVWLICGECPEEKRCYDSHLHSTCEYTDYCDEVSLTDAVKVAISALSVNKGKWIPVSERLPEDGKFVLFCDIDDDIMIGYHVKGRPRTHFTQDMTFEDMKNVRAWQPLPEPYKAESEE